ncbi:MAG: CocE/NonD family hydrolase [Limisphaerales bacterium]
MVARNQGFTQAGYAWIAVSLRGTGASFGTRDLELGDAEVDDLMDVLDWVLKQPWSDGRVALMGGSYDGVTAEVLAGRGHPAVKAAVLQASWLDTYEFLFPGGLYRQGFVDEWTRVALGFDANDWPTAMGLSGWQRQALGWFVRGHKPVDGVGGKRLLREAVAGHRTQPANELSRDTIYRDDTPRGAVTNWSAFSPYRARAGLEHAPVPLQVWVSWLDAQLATHALAKFRSYRFPQQLVMCAWNHHLAADGDLFKPVDAPADPPPPRSSGG